MYGCTSYKAKILPRLKSSPVTCRKQVLALPSFVDIGQYNAIFQQRQTATLKQLADSLWDLYFAVEQRVLIPEAFAPLFWEEAADRLKEAAEMWTAPGTPLRSLVGEAAFSDLLSAMDQVGNSIIRLCLFAVVWLCQLQVLTTHVGKHPGPLLKG